MPHFAFRRPTKKFNDVVSAAVPSAHCTATFERNFSGTDATSAFRVGATAAALPTHGKSWEQTPIKSLGFGVRHADDCRNATRAQNIHGIFAQPSAEGGESSR